MEECPGTCNMTPALHHRLSNQEEARVFSNRGEERERERDDVEQKVALALRCDDAKMSLVVRKNEKVCAVFIQKASLEHPPPDRTRGGDARCGPTSSQRQGAQLPVDPEYVRRSRRARLGAFPGG